MIVVLRIMRLPTAADRKPRAPILQLVCRVPSDSLVHTLHSHEEIHMGPLHNYVTLGGGWVG